MRSNPDGIEVPELSNPSAADGVSQAEWLTPVDRAVAAHDGRRAYRRVARPFPERQPNNMRFAVYVSIALSEAIWAKFGFSADRSAMQRLAGELYPRWHSILIHDETRLFEPLCSAIGIARESEEVLGDEGVTNMTVALGVFLDEPAKDLSRLRPRVAAAWARGETDWRELGIWPAS